MNSEDPDSNTEFNFDNFKAPSVVDYDDSLILTQTVDSSGSSGVRLYQLEDSIFAFTTFSRDIHSGTGWSEFLLAKGNLTLHPPSFDMAALSSSISDLPVQISESQLDGALEIYKTQCVKKIESALFDPTSNYEVVFRGPVAYVEDFSWPSPLLAELSSILEPDQLDPIYPLILTNREGVEEDSWTHLRGHYMALIEIL